MNVNKLQGKNPFLLFQILMYKLSYMPNESLGIDYCGPGDSLDTHIAVSS